MGNGRAVEFVSLVKSNMNRHFVVSVSPNSMRPKDEVSEQNLALDLWKAQALDPVSLFKKLDFLDPLETAKQVAMWITNPQLYIQTMFPETVQQPLDSANPPPGGEVAPVEGQPPQPGLASGQASSALSQVPLKTNAIPR